MALGFLVNLGATTRTGELATQGCDRDSITLSKKLCRKCWLNVGFQGFRGSQFVLFGPKAPGNDGLRVCGCFIKSTRVEGVDP